MAIQFGNQPLDALFAPGISSFNKALIPDLGGECPQADHWLSNLFLNSLLGPRYNAAWKQTAVTFLFRTQNALRAYNLARTKTLECVAAFQPGRPASKLYFEAVSHWESVLINIQIAIDLYLWVIEPGAAETDDATRIRLAANRVKHYAEDIANRTNHGDLTLPMWLTESGIKTAAAEVTFEELAENLCEMGVAADLLQNPGLTPPTQ